jgi:hypothetical protein
VDVYQLHAIKVSALLVAVKLIITVIMLLVLPILIVSQALAIMANAQCVIMTHQLVHIVMANHVLLILFVPLELVLKACV